MAPMLALALAFAVSAVAAPPPSASTTFALAAPGLTSVEVTDAQAAFFLDYFSQQLAQQGGIRVTTGKEIADVIGVERQRQLLGCDEAATNCMAEIAGALGVQGVITGSVAKTSGGYAVTLKIVSATDAHPLGVYSGRAKSDDELLDRLGEAAVKLAAEIHRQHPETMPPGATATAATSTTGPDASTTATTTAESGRSPLALPLAIASGVLLAGSGALYAAAKSTENDIRTAAPSITDEHSMTDAVNRGKTIQTLSAVSLGVGVAAGAVATVMFLRGGEPAPVAVGVTPSGAALVFSGTLP